MKFCFCIENNRTAGFIIFFVNFIFAVIDNIYTIHFYLKRDEVLTQTEILLSTLAVIWLFVEVVLFYGLLRKIPKLILTWIIIETVGITVG